MRIFAALLAFVLALPLQAADSGKQEDLKGTGVYGDPGIADAVKQGFSAPDASWFKGESIEFVKRKLVTGNPRIYEYLDADAIRELVHQHLDGRENRRLLIWSLLNVEEVLACTL